MNYMHRWGFLTDPKKFVGKTIQAVEHLRMEFGCTQSESLAFQFTDGTRGWILGHGGQHCEPNPDEPSLAKSMIITPEEYGQYQADKLRRKQSHLKQETDHKRLELQRLKKELGEE